LIPQDLVNTAPKRAERADNDPTMYLTSTLEGI